MNFLLIGVVLSEDKEGTLSRWAEEITMYKASSALKTSINPSFREVALSPTSTYPVPGQTRLLSVCVKSLSRVQLFATPWTVCSPSGSSVHGILQARILEWVAISFSRGSSQPRDRTQVSHIAGRRFIL